MIRRLYDWVLGLANHPHALWALAVVAFLESSVFPIPPDVLMIPMILARALRFFIVAALLWKFGAPIRDFIERRLPLVFTVFVVLLFGSFFLLRYL